MDILAIGLISYFILDKQQTGGASNITIHKIKTLSFNERETTAYEKYYQLDQVHLACRTQLLLPGLDAVVHHVHVHHVTWECHI